jgi:hypothetical protein
VPSSPLCSPSSCDCPWPLFLKSIAPGQLPSFYILLFVPSCRSDRATNCSHTCIASFCVRPLLQIQ